jgi:purine-nucleoside phosphorylase
MLTAAAANGAHTGPVATTDLFYDARDDLESDWIKAGAVAVEMESATLFALARRRGLQAASLLVVSDLLLPTRTRIDPEALIAAEHRMGTTAYQALADKGQAQVGHPHGSPPRVSTTGRDGRVAPPVIGTPLTEP